MSHAAASSSSSPLAFDANVECVLRTNSGGLYVDSGLIGWLVFDSASKSVNVLTPELIEDTQKTFALLDDLVARGRVRVLVVTSGKRNSFILGADVTALYPMTNAEDALHMVQSGHRLLTRLESLRLPTIAAINGACLGGGLEVALACRFRVCSDSPAVTLGLPEVKLGLLPGAGGTVRLTRLVGLQQSLQVILPGGSLSASKAKRVGLVDAVLEGTDRFDGECRFYHSVRKYATRFIDARGPAPRVGPMMPTLRDRLLDGTTLGRWFVRRMAENGLMKMTKGRYPAPLLALDSAYNACSGELAAALQFEAKRFAALCATPESKNLIAVFFMMEASKKRDAVLPGVQTGRSVSKVGVIGAGVMGSGIAQLVAHKQIRVHMKDIKDEFVSKGMSFIRSTFDDLVQRKKMASADAKARLALVTGSTTNEGFRECQVVVEAAVERMDLKKRILQEVEPMLGEHGVFATNTSSLSIDELASAAARPERVLGMHFFNPVHKMPLVEIVRGRKTSDEAVAAVYDLTLRLGKTPVVVHDGPGFLVNRILGIYLNEAGRLLAEGEDVATIDKALLAFGMPMGPFRLIDEVGLDVGSHVAEILHAGLGDRFATPPGGDIISKMVSASRLGKKANAGFYKYQDGKSQGVDPLVVQQVAALRRPKVIAPADIVDRCVLLMVNEAAMILSEKLVARAEDVDLGMVFGTGFPPFRGGLLQHADHYGVARVVERLRQLAQTLGSKRYEPVPLLVEMASAGKRFFPSRPAVPYVERTVPRPRL